RSRDRFDERVDVKRIKLIKDDYRDQKPIAQGWWGHGSELADDDVNIGGPGHRANRLHQKIQVGRITWSQEISFQALNREDPADRRCQVRVGSLIQYGVEGLPV